MMTPVRAAIAAVVATASLAGPETLRAQSYPARSVTLIVPSAAGGGTDTIARLIGDQLSKQLGQGFVVENRTGAGLVVGTTAAAKAAPDGYTLLVGLTGNMSVNPSLFAKLPYDSIADFTPVAMLADYPFLVVVNNDLPAKYTKQVNLTSNETGLPTTRPQGEVLRERYAEITAMDRAIGRLRRHLAARISVSAVSIAVSSEMTFGLDVMTSPTRVAGSLPAPSTRSARSRSVIRPTGRSASSMTTSVPTPLAFMRRAASAAVSVVSTRSTSRQQIAPTDM